MTEHDLFAKHGVDDRKAGRWKRREEREGEGKGGEGAGR